MRIRLNPDWVLKKGILLDDEGNPLEIKALGKGMFTRAFLTERNRVILICHPAAYEKEILRDLSENPYFPKTKYLGDLASGHRIYEMPLYKAPLRAGDSKVAWMQYMWLKVEWARVSYRAPRNKSGYDQMYDFVEHLKNAASEVGPEIADPKLIDALDEITGNCSNYSDSWLFEFSPRNLATDENGHLILLDVIFDREVLRSIRR